MSSVTLLQPWEEPGGTHLRGLPSPGLGHAATGCYEDQTSGVTPEGAMQGTGYMAGAPRIEFGSALGDQGWARAEPEA